MLQRLDIIDFRNISTLQIHIEPGFNVIHGKNGSGKTSILEAIYILSTGKSFRSHLVNRLIQEGKEKFFLHAHIQENLPIGIEKSLDGKTMIRFDGETQTSIAKLAEVLPLQLINPDGFRLLEDGSKPRRQFLDWGLFHVEQTFFPLWHRAQRALHQRNVALRQLLSEAEIRIWDNELVVTNEAIDILRSQYMETFLAVFLQFCKILLPECKALNLSYFRGWNEKFSLHEALSRCFERDQHVKYTNAGIHRADLVIKVGSMPAVDVLSRGQQKLLVCALRLAQDLLLLQLTDKRCVYLIDDLPAELDVDKRKLIIDSLLELESQVFITCVELAALGNRLGRWQERQTRVFHVEQGIIR